MSPEVFQCVRGQWQAQLHRLGLRGKDFTGRLADAGASRLCASHDQHATACLSCVLARHDEQQR